MSEHLSWDEIKSKYPKQWVSLYDLEYDESGEVISAAVFAADPELKVVSEKSKGVDFKSHMFKFTGPIKNFLGSARWAFTDVNSEK